MKKKYRNYIILIFTILLVVFVTTKFSYVFGSDTDWINQHTIICDYFRQMFYKTRSLIPNLALNYGAGQNIFNLSYYGLLSPIILFSYLLPFISMKDYITVVNIVLVILSSILFYNFLKNHKYSDNISLVTSLIFTLSACFIFHMHRHIMFVNYMPFLIMSLIGVDKLILDNKRSYLIISIFLMIMTSYYYSVCGILVVGIYYLYEYLKLEKKLSKKFIKDLFKFIGLVLISIMMAAILLIPTLYTLVSGRGDNTSSVSILSLFIPYLKIHKIFCGTYAIGLSMIAFISLLYLFFTKKRHNVIIATIISIILFIPIFRYVLNGGLYLREKCFIPFMPLFGYFIAYFLKDLLDKKINLKKFIIYLVIILGSLYFFNKNEVCYLFALGFILLLLIYQKKDIKKIICSYLVLFAFITAIVENVNEELVSIDKYNEIFSKDVSSVIKNTLDSDDSYFRTSSLRYPTKTLNKIYNDNYYTTSIYSSTYNPYYLDFVRNTFKTSMFDYNYFLVSGANDLIFNTYMGVKYLVADFDVGLGYEKINDYMYKNDNVYPMFYATSNILNENVFDSYDYPYQLELLLNNVIVDDNSSQENLNININEVNLNYDVIENDGISYSKDNDNYILTVDEKGYLNLKLSQPLNGKILILTFSGLKENSCSYDNISMKINNVENILTCRSWIYPNKNNTFRYVISDDVITNLKIEFSKGTYNINDFHAYVLDYDAIKNLRNKLTAFNVKEIKNDKIKGDIKIEQDSYFVTSLPYDEGFKVVVDGNNVEPVMVNKSFLGFKISNGYHEIEISYKSPWLNIGYFVSGIGLVLLILVIRKDLKIKKQ